MDELAFTGPVPTGSKVMATAARDIKAISPEIRGKSPLNASGRGRGMDHVRHLLEPWRGLRDDVARADRAVDP
ncbi:hypothetical protein [Paracoccus beibuensis]|uniref:hypothetical protein n=1 Tax=Paracoccus beibuensis TaxID=547602 RepID=UPI00389913AE